MEHKINKRLLKEVLWKINKVDSDDCGDTIYQYRVDFYYHGNKFYEDWYQKKPLDSELSDMIESIVQDGEVQIRPLRFSVNELYKDEKSELKAAYLTQHLMETENREPYMSELADADNIVSDSSLYEQYAGVTFVAMDFSCNGE